MSAPRDTIAAVATPAGAGGVGVLRISGPDAGRIAETFLGRAPRPRHAHYTAFRDAAGDTIDRGLLLHFPQPHSYTGEDVAELQTHGAPVVLNLLLRRVCELGARPARAGEFSERAFLNGKLDLAQAEAVADLIASRSEAAARAALHSLDGVFSQRVHELLDALIRLRLWIEAAMDFPEEDIDFLATPRLQSDLAAVRERVHRLLADARRGVRLADGLHAVIVGRPNAGKSSLLNALAASDRAIVAPIAGTTRDLLRESIEIDGLALTLVDTAGLRDAGDAVEREGMRRARAELARADVAILVTDQTEWRCDLDLLPPLPDGCVRLVVHNKIDLHGSAPRREEEGGRIHVHLSATHGAGLHLLREELTRLAGASDGGAFSARTRHVLALQQVGDHVAAAENVLLQRRAGELAAEELRQAQQRLAELTGEFTSDDLLGRIFASFCIGK